MKNSLIFTAIVCIIFSTTQCSTSPKEFVNDPLDTNRDTTVLPNDNFFRYANGGWFKKNPIASSDQSNGIFNTIGDTINSQIKQICINSSANTNSKKGSNEQKIGDFYASGMDTLAIEKIGLKPLEDEFNKIEKISDINTLLATAAYLHTIGASPMFSFYIGQDDKISSKHALFFGQGGIGLGDRDYYFNTDKETENIRKEYVKHLKAMLSLIGQNNTEANSNASKIMKLETDLAKVSRKLEMQRDPMMNYNKMSLTQFNKSTSKINWTAVLGKIGLKNVDTVIVRQPEFYTALNEFVTSYSLEDWKVYLKWNLLDSYANYLTKVIQKQNFKFYATIMNGVKEQKPRWEAVVSQTNSSLGELIGQIYVNEYLPKGSKEKLLEIGNSIRDVYAEHIQKLDWMSETTKKKALHKLSMIIMKVGYPDKWKDMSALKVSRKSYCENVMNSNKWEFKFMLNKYRKPVNKSEWAMYPQTYNAYYDPSNNEIVVPACNIIVPGFEGRMPDDAILYGIIGGSTFGHEITHGFDDQGCQYDEKGNLKNWWTKEDLSKFQSKTKLIVEQFNNFKVLGTKHVNGDATQGENIADLGGVVMGLEAFKRTSQFKKNTVISGMKPLQRFFLAYGYAWMVNINDKALANQIMTDVHAPAQFRINGPLSNIPEFYTTFNIKKGDQMYLAPEKRVVIW
ncbi:MAG: M13 family metallopeptidase [Flavobacteriia bacterium]|nr:M13 family metallopeptidase [Flavobacteriia bacterium]